MYFMRLFIVSFLLFGCQRGPSLQPLPRRDKAWPAADLVLVWHGRGQGYRMTKAGWQRTPSFDYDFTVVQRRYREHWESTKTLERRHPDYDGSAGPRAQTYHFSLQYQGQGSFAVKSTLGPGKGETDEEFRKARMTIKPEISSYAPFNAYTIEQHYDYGEGSLRETVTLSKQRSSGDKPWAKVDEEARLFAPHRFPEPPTRLRQ